MIGLPASQWSLIQRQFVLIGGLLTMLAVALGIGGYWFIQDVAERMSDRLLAGSIKSLSDALGEENGAITMEIPASAFGMLEDSARDNVYYVVRQNGRTLTGYPAFPRAMATRDAAEAISFRYDRFLGQRIRVATLSRVLPRMNAPVTIQVAETMGERNALAGRMLLGLVALEVVLVLFAVFLIWPAIHWGLAPVHQLQRQMEDRPSDRIDFTPIDARGVPPELRGLVAGFNALLGRLELSVQGMRRFTADAAHQMRTPLAVLKTHIGVLRQRLAPDSSLDDIDAAAQRLERLLTQLLMMARAEHLAAPAGDGTRSDAQEATRAACLEIAPQALEQGINVEFAATGTFAVAMDRLLLEELVSNVIDNAVRYNRPGGTVSVSVLREDDAGLIEVLDDGPGIPEEARDKVFDRFFRMERDQAKPGSGLGLPIARALVNLGGGTIELASPPGGQGLAVRFRFAL